MDNVSGTYFVTGATGFIGGRLCAALRSEKHVVRALVRRDEVPFLEKMGVDLIVGDLLDPSSYCDAIVGCDYVIHLGGDPTFANGSHYQKINYEATKQLVAIIRDKAPNLRRLVFVSTLGAVDRERSDDCNAPLTELSKPSPTTDYGRSKLAAEEAVRASDVPWSIVRPTLVIGSEMRFNSHVAVFCRMAARRSLLSRLDLPGRMSLIHVDDVVSALQFCATRNNTIGKTFFVAGESVSLGEIFSLSDSSMGRIPVSWIRPILRPLLRFIPFTLKALFFHALEASDKALSDAGWKATHLVHDEVRGIALRERRRVDCEHPVPGFTLVTGAASGLGAALVRELALRGRKLILVDKNAQGLAGTLPGREGVVRVTCDLARDDDMARLFAMPQWEGEGIAEVFSCAGVGVRGMVTEASSQRQLDVLRVNLLSRLALARHAILHMQRRAFGRVILVSSSSAFQALPYMTVYAASNAGLLSLGEGLWGELEDFGVEVLTVCPGGMGTNFQGSAGVRVIEGERLDTPEWVAKKIIETGLGRNRGVMVVNSRARIMDVMARFIPRHLRVRLWRRLMQNLR